MENIWRLFKGFKVKISKQVQGVMEDRQHETLIEQVIQLAFIECHLYTVTKAVRNNVPLN